MKYLLPLFIFLSLKSSGQIIFENVLWLHADRQEVRNIIEQIKPDVNLDEITKIAEQVIENNKTDIHSYLPKAFLTANLQGINKAYASLDALSKEGFSEEAILYAKAYIAYEHEHTGAAEFYFEQLQEGFPKSKYTLQMAIVQDGMFNTQILHDDFQASLDDLIRAENNVSDRIYLQLVKAEADNELSEAIVKDIWAKHPEQLNPLSFYYWADENLDDDALKSQAFQRIDFSRSYTFLLLLSMYSELEPEQEEKSIIKLIEASAETVSSNQSAKNVIGRFVFKPSIYKQLSSDVIAKFNFSASEKKVYSISEENLGEIINCTDNGDYPTRRCIALLDSLSKVLTKEESDMLIEIGENEIKSLLAELVDPIEVEVEQEISCSLENLNDLKVALLHNPIRDFSICYEEDIFMEILPVLDEVCEKYPGAESVFRYRTDVLELAIEEEIVTPDASLYKKYISYVFETLAVFPNSMRGADDIEVALEECACEDAVETQLNDLIKQHPHNEYLLEMKEDLYGY